MFQFLSCLLFPLFLLSSDLRGFWCLQLLLFARKLCSSLLPLFLCQDLGCVHGKSCIALIHCVELLFLSKESSGSFDCWSFTVLSLSSPLSPPHSLSPNFSFSFSYLFPLTSDPFFCFTVLVFSRHLDSFFCYYCCLSKEFFFFLESSCCCCFAQKFCLFFQVMCLPKHESCLQGGSFRETVARSKHHNVTNCSLPDEEDYTTS